MGEQNGTVASKQVLRNIKEKCTIKGKERSKNRKKGELEKKQERKQKKV